MMPARPGPVAIRSAFPDSLQPALEVFFRELPSHERSQRVAETIESVQQGELDLSEMLIAESSADIDGVVLMMPQVDGSAFVWPPVIRAGDRHRHDEIADALLTEVRSRCIAHNCWIGQALLEPSQHQEYADLQRNGFRELARLQFMQRFTDGPPPSRHGRQLTAIPFDSAQASQRFARVIDRTYEASLDCPELRMRRTAEEALASHRLSGELRPELWNILAVDGEEIGLVLLGDHPEQDACELVYMGLVPEARGRGYGEDLLIDAIRRVHGLGRTTLFLAVDNRNTYAKALYIRCGFREVGNKIVCAWLSREPEHINR